MMWADFSDWLLTVGVIVGYVTVIVALIATIAIRSPLRGWTWQYATGNVVALILATFNMLVHTRYRQHETPSSLTPLRLLRSVSVGFLDACTGLYKLHSVTRVQKVRQLRFI